MKTVLDAIQGVVYRNDRQVAEIHARRRQAKPPSIRLRVTEL